MSVIIPTYGARGNLQDVIKSVLEQDYPLIEIIVVDDNNPDTIARKQTEDIMSSFVSEDLVIYIKHNVNRNGAAARNTGIRNSRGEFIAFLDDDDLFLPHKISKQVVFLQKHTNFSAVYCYASNDKIPRVTLEGDLRKQLLLLETKMYTPSLMFRREALEEIGGFDESFRRHQDYELLMHFFNNGFVIGCLPEKLIKLGGNGGENALSGDKLVLLKQQFLSQFCNQIHSLDETNHNFANRVRSKHYATVVLTYIKECNFASASRILFTECRHAPFEVLKIFWLSIYQHIINYIKRLKR